MTNDQQQPDIIKKYLNLLWSRHKLILGCLLLSLTVGYMIYLFIPKTYQSSASIIYQQQKINPSKLSPDEEKRIEEMVNTVSQQVISRTSLEKIIKEFNLYPELREEIPIEDVITKMRENILISVQRAKGNVFTVSFQGIAPNQVMRVTNALASRFIEENLRVREERATETTSYIKDELRMSKDTLDKKDALMRDYKLKYFNEMPDQRQSNIERLNALQEQFHAAQTNIQTLEQTRLLVTEQQAAQKNRYNSTSNVASANDGAMNLAVAHKILQELLARYTADHPMVKRAEKRISQLELEEKSNPKGSHAVASLAGNSDFSVQLKEIELNLKTLRDQSENILTQIKNYQSWIDTTPIREAEWVALTRDYNELKKYYDTLLAQSLTAAATESIEMRQKGSQFKLVDPAYLPEKPVTGNFLKMLMVATFLGLASGVGLVMGFDFMDTSFKDVQEIENYLHLPVTCALPFIVIEQERQQEKKRNILWYCFFAVWLLIIILATVYLSSRGNIIF